MKLKAAIASDAADAAGRQFEFVLNELSRRMRRVYNRMFQEAGVSAQQAAVLLFLDQFGAQTQNELAERLELGKAATAALLARMEAIQLVTRIPGERDRRERQVSLAPKAKAIVARIDELGARIGAQSREGIDREDRRVATRVLLAMKENLRQLEETLDRGTHQAAAE